MTLSGKILMGIFIILTFISMMQFRIIKNCIAQSEALTTQIAVLEAKAESLTQQYELAHRQAEGEMQKSQLETAEIFSGQNKYGL